MNGENTPKSWRQYLGWIIGGSLLVLALAAGNFYFTYSRTANAITSNELQTHAQAEQQARTNLDATLKTFAKQAVIDSVLGSYATEAGAEQKTVEIFNQYLLDTGAVPAINWDNIPQANADTIKIEYEAYDSGIYKTDQPATLVAYIKAINKQFPNPPATEEVTKTETEGGTEQVTTPPAGSSATELSPAMKAQLERWSKKMTPAKK